MSLLRSALLLLFLGACQTEPSLLGGGDADGQGQVADTQPLDLLPGPEDLAGGELAPKDLAEGDQSLPKDSSPGDSTDPGPYEGLFQDRVVLHFELEFPVEDWEALLDSLLDCEEDMCGSARAYTSGTLSFHNPWTGEVERLENVGLRYRGNSSACMPENNPRIGFKVSLNEYVPGRRFHGQKKLNFLGTEGDGSLLREVLAFEALEKFGLPAAGVGFAWVRVNGGPGRLYPLIQESDDTPYIEEVLGETDKGAYFKVDGYCGRPEFDEWEEGVLPEDLTRIWEPKAGTLPEDMTSTLIPFLQCFDLDGDQQFQDCFEDHADLDLWLRAIAVDICMPDHDGFTYGGKNHSLYFRKADNQAVVVLWDKDGSFNPQYCGNSDPFECIAPWIGSHPDGIQRLEALYWSRLTTLMYLFTASVMGDSFLPLRLEHWYGLLLPYSLQDDQMSDQGGDWDWPDSVQTLRDKILARRATLLDALAP